MVEQKDRFIAVKVTPSFNRKVQDTVLEILNLKNLNHLRDKFEGQAFFNKVSTFLFGMQVLENLLGQPIINWKKLKKKEFQSDLSLLELDVKVVIFKMGELPVIDAENQSPIIFILKRNDTSGWICGIANVAVLNEVQNRQTIPNTGSDYSGRVSFVGFNKLEKFESLDELKKGLSKNELSIR